MEMTGNVSGGILINVSDSEGSTVWMETMDRKMILCSLQLVNLSLYVFFYVCIVNIVYFRWLA